MKSDLELALKKQRLVLASAALRQSLAEDARPLRPLLGAADTVAAGVRWIKARPGLVALATAVAVVSRPRFLLRWGRRGYLAWKTLRLVRTRLYGE